MEVISISFPLFYSLKADRYVQSTLKRGTQWGENQEAGSQGAILAAYPPVCFQRKWSLNGSE